MKKSTLLLILPLLIFSCQTTNQSKNSNVIYGTKGLHGYIAYDSPAPPDGYGAGVAFYSAVWPLISEPLKNFQIGLPGTWITPDNRDNADIPLCPVGTHARDNWPERAPTYSSVFQTLEGGLGYWAGNRFRYGPPKFSMNATASCYDYEIASPGWSFFYSDTTLAEDQLGIAQLHNRLLVPPDGLTFEGNPNGQFLGYSYMALPFTDPKAGETPIGDQSWTCFLNAANFSGPIAYYLPETWTKVTVGHPEIHGRGLDARAGIIRGGAMEINTVPHFEGKDQAGNVYIKIPQLSFPVDEEGKAPLVQDLTFYSKDGLYNSVKAWRKNGTKSNGIFNESGAWKPELSTRPPKYDQDRIPLTNINDVFQTAIFEGNVFGVVWKKNSISIDGKFPQYFKQIGQERIAISSSEVPEETGLLSQDFPVAEERKPYTSPNKGVWTSPGAAKGPFTVKLNDGSTVTYSWYKFIDQPTFQQFDWSAEERDALQTFIEQIHASWTMDKEYMEPPTKGEMANLDPALIVSPPEGMEVGYVPIVIRQER